METLPGSHVANSPPEKQLRQSVGLDDYELRPGGLREELVVEPIRGAIKDASRSPAAGANGAVQVIVYGLLGDAIEHEHHRTVVGYRVRCPNQGPDQLWREEPPRDGTARGRDPLHYLR